MASLSRQLKVHIDKTSSKYQQFLEYMNNPTIMTGMVNRNINIQYFEPRQQSYFKAQLLDYDGRTQMESTQLNQDLFKDVFATIEEPKKKRGRPKKNLTTTS